jgi:TolB-like protein
MTSRFPNRWNLPVLGVAMLIAGASWIKWHRARSLAGRTRTTEDRTIVVSPFTSLVAQDRDLGASLAMQVESALGASHQVTTRTWEMVAPSAPPLSAQATTDAAALIVGRHRGASYILVGQLEHLGTRIEIGVRLLRVCDGYPVWSGTYWRDSDGLNAFPPELALDVSEALHLSNLGGRSTPNRPACKSAP